MKFTIFKDSRGGYRWNLKAANGRIIADSGEGYSSNYAVRVAINRFKSGVFGATIVDLTLSRTV
jgi:uncharacterized protein YegP (UPF0339 family)